MCVYRVFVNGYLIWTIDEPNTRARLSSRTQSKVIKNQQKWIAKAKRCGPMLCAHWASQNQYATVSAGKWPLLRR